jgi:hypothetical protein
MKTLMMLAGAAALAIAGPVAAKPGKGHGNKAHGHSKAHVHKGQVHKGHFAGGLYAPGIGGCPPGLAKRNNGCLPPGHAKQLFNVGQRFDGRYGSLWNYNQIPLELRSHYDLTRSGRYYYRDGYLYRVDPRTMVVQQVLSAILR